MAARAARFSDRETVMLISYYHGETLLWQREQHDYHNTQARTEAFRRIATQLGPQFTWEMVRAKLETLRGQYVREMLRLEAGARKLLPPKWKYFHHLEFLRDVITPRQAVRTPSSATASPQDDTGENSPLRDYDDNDDDNDDDDAKTSLTTSSISEAETLAPPAAKLPRTWSDAEEEKCTVVQCMKYAVGVLRSLQERNAASSTCTSTAETEDEDGLFGRTVAMKMRQIRDCETKIEAKYRIERVLANAIHGHRAARLHGPFFIPSCPK